jgi:PilZ domain
MSGSPERRATERFPINADAVCQFLSPVVEDHGPVKIKDISMQGIGLIVSKRVEAGALLAVTLANAAKGFNKTVMVRVAHVTPQPGNYLIGGTFVHPLTYQEMTSLVL